MKEIKPDKQKKKSTCRNRDSEKGKQTPLISLRERKGIALVRQEHKFIEMNIERTKEILEINSVLKIRWQKLKILKNS